MNDINDLKALTSSLNLLLVDDEQGAREHIQKFLSLIFKKVFAANDGEDAVRIYKEENIDIIITDLLMPKMDGFGLIDAIRSINKQQKIIIMSAQADKETIVKAIMYSVDGYILKPINDTQVFEAIAKTVSAFRMERENMHYQHDLETKVEEQVSKIALYSKQMINQLESDSLTGLPNKSKFEMDYLKGKFKWLMLVNIDNLEYINIAYGPVEGDLLLKLVAEFLVKVVGKNVYRMNGDEFMIGTTLIDKESVAKFAEDIQEKIYSKRFDLTNDSVRITFSIGIVQTEYDVIRTCRNASIAIKQARKMHKNVLGFYYDDPEVKEYHKKVTEWVHKAKLALDLDLLVPYFQPIVNVRTNKIEKYECLARIIEKDSVITPINFILPTQIAGMIVDVTKRIIIKAFEYFSDFDYELSINITDDDLKEEYLIDFLNEATQKYKISRNRVVLEVLENVSNYDAVHACEQLETLKSLGYKIAIDDFGAESSNFARSQKLNSDYIKIDGSFIKNLIEDEDSLHIVKTIIYYARECNIKTIAEYVHNEDVYNKVIELGIDYVQGYYISEPLKDIQ